MRTLSDSLKKAQQSVTLNPLYKIVLTKGESTYTYGNERILPSKHDEEMYSHKATIVLDNSDHELDDIDLKGYDAVISYGFNGEYSATAPLSVTDQQFDSDPNKLICTLELQGMPNLMAQDEASESYIPEADAEETVKDLVDAIVKAELTPFTHCHAFEITWDAGYDTLADTYKPADGFRIYVGGTRLAAIRRLLDYTGNVPRFQSDGLHILKPVIEGTIYDSEYALGKGYHNFFSKAYRNTLVFPNRVVVTSRPDDDPFSQGEAQVEDYDSLPDKVKKTNFIQARLKDDDQADDIAEALIAKAEMGSKRGEALVPINVGAEVFDYVKVTDKRQGDTRTGNLGYIHRRFGKDTWVMTFGFGNWLEVLRYQAILKELETYTDAGQYFSRLQVGDLYAEHIQADSLDMVWIDPDGNIDLSKIGDNLDNLPDGEVYARIKSMHLDAGVLQLDENVIYKAGYDPSTKWTGSDLDDLPDGTVYQRVKSAALSAGGLILLDQVVVGTYGLVKATDISAGHILLSTVTQNSSYQTVSSSQKTTWNNKPDDMDDIPNGSTYQKLLATDISSGHIKLTTGTVWSGKVTVRSGITIDSSGGINIWGLNNALTTRATETGTIQCSVNSSGQITAGAGTILLGSTGLEINGQKLFFNTGSGNNYGKIYLSSDDLYIVNTNYEIYMQAATNMWFSAGSGYAYYFSNAPIRVPTLSSAPSAVTGFMFFNTTTHHLQYYTGSKWVIAQETDV
jgi:hypothetical protein